MSNNWLPLIRMIEAAICCEDIRDIGFFLVAAGWIVVVFASSGVITGSIMIIFGVDNLIARLLALNLEQAGQA